MHHHRTKTGFTLIELSLAVTFIALLSLSIAIIATSLIATYQRGLILKQVNTTGTEIITELRSAIQKSPAGDLRSLCDATYSASSALDDCRADFAQSFISLTRKMDVTVKRAGRTETFAGVPAYGAFCSGSYTYIWNSGYYFNDDYETPTTIPSAKFTYRDEANQEQTIEDFRLLKVFDPLRSVCIEATKKANLLKPYTQNANISNLTNEFTVGKYTDTLYEQPVDLLRSSDSRHNLTLYSLNIARPALDTLFRNIFYTGDFILATVQGGIDITTTGNYCATPEQYEIENFDYCAINKFNFAAQAIGG